MQYEAKHSYLKRLSGLIRNLKICPSLCLSLPKIYVLQNGWQQATSQHKERS